MTRRADTTARIHLALSNLDMVGIAVGKAVADGAEVDDICMLLLDTRDAVARGLAAATLQNSSDLDLDPEEARVLARDQIPTGVAIIAARAAELLFAETHPAVAEGIRLRPPVGHVRVIAVAVGGASLVHLPVAPVGAGSA